MSIFYEHHHQWQFANWSGNINYAVFVCECGATKRQKMREEQ